MATATGIGFPGLGGREVVAQMTGGTGALGTIGVDTANTGIGPAGLVQRTVGIHTHDGAVTGGAAHGGDGRGSGQGGRAFHHFSQHIVQGTKNIARGGMVAAIKLFHFTLVALGTVFGRDDDRDHEILVHNGIFFAAVGLVAFVAAHVGGKVLGMSPLVIDARGLLPVTGHAGDALAAELIETGQNLHRLLFVHDLLHLGLSRLLGGRSRRLGLGSRRGCRHLSILPPPCRIGMGRGPQHQGQQAQD